MKIYRVVETSFGGYDETSESSITYLHQEDAQKFFDETIRKWITEDDFEIRRKENDFIEYCDKSHKWFYTMGIEDIEIHDHYDENDRCK